MTHPCSFLRRTALLLLASALSAGLAGQNPWTGLQQLAGLWQRSGKPTFEKWEIAGPDALLGEGFRQAADGSKQTTEFLRLLRSDAGIVYQATVPDQNDGATIDFPLVFFTATSWTFENPGHDFPQKIEYWFQDSLTLRVSLSGGAEEPLVLWFSRAPEAQQQPVRTLQGYQLFVSSRNTNSVKRFDAFTGAYLGELGQAQIGGQTQDVTIGPDGMLYVSALQAGHILKFDPASGAFLGNFTHGYDLKKPTKMLFAPDGYLYVSQWGEGQSNVARFDARSGAFDRVCTGDLAGPLGLTVDAGGNFYVACFYSKDVRKFGPDGAYLGLAVDAAQLKGPSNIWFDKQGALLVADWDAGSIKRFRPENGGFAYEREFATGFARLEGLALGPDGFLYACDWYRNLIQKLDATSGSAIGVYLDGGGMQQPNALTFWKVKM
ncbi:MAG: NHL repeat-containing protein [Saprospiraceae bacterium]|nr:NHL repeat-containing protein [Saprospiraceae bacterium]